MKKNPIIPYILIMAFGIGLIFFMSLDGADKKKKSQKAMKLKLKNLLKVKKQQVNLILKHSLLVNVSLATVKT